MNAIILSGGEGKRFTPLKPFLKIGDETIIERQIQILKEIFESIIVVTNSAHLYKDLDVKIVSDIVSSKGSLVGIYSGLKASNAQHNFVVASDMPFINPHLINYMIDLSKDYDIIIPKWQGNLEPLFAIYSKNCLSPIDKQLKDNHLKIIDFFKEVKVRIITEGEINRFDPEKLSFININTKQEYLKIQSPSLTS